MIRKILVLQHVNWRNPGRLLLDLSRKLPVEMHVVKRSRERIPRGIDFDGLILLGGEPNNGWEEDDCSVKEEKEFLTNWFAHEKPCLGFCLGHKLLTDTFQAKITKNYANSAGFIKGYLTHDGRQHPLFKGIAPTFLLFKWHRQSIQTPLPRDIIMLATSSDCMVEAFTVKGRPYIVGLQFDNHAAHPADICKWLENDKDWLQTSSLNGKFRNELLNEAEENLQTNKKVLHTLIDNFIVMIKDTRNSPY